MSNNPKPRWNISTKPQSISEIASIETLKNALPPSIGEKEEQRSSRMKLKKV